MQTIPLSSTRQRSAIYAELKRVWHNIKKEFFGYHYQKDYYYERILTKYHGTEEFNKLLERNLISLHSKADIKLEFGDSCLEIKEKYGVPDFKFKFKYKESSIINHKIYFYRLKMGEYKTKCEMHFFDNKLFYKSYTLNYLTHDDKCKIIDTISHKYLDKPFLHKTTKIVDSYGKVILIEDVVDFTIFYLDSGSEFFVNLESLNNKKGKEKENQVIYVNKDLQNRL